MVGDPQHSILAVPQPNNLAQRIVDWQAAHGRHDLPWQASRDAYQIWLSEIMLQQTQVTTVIPYFNSFLQHFPTVDALANATLDEVMVHWAGLGYYSRARNLHRCAQIIQQHWQGRFPRTVTQLATLPGIGPTTAAAIAAQAFGARAAILDGNVKRVLARLFAITTPVNERATEKRLWQHAQALIDAADAKLNMRAYTQGMMDLGATVCKRSRPQCVACPLSEQCRAYALGKQGELPLRQRRKPVPRRACAMLILTDNNHVLLERQPDSGLWSNLWSLPQFNDRDQLDEALTQIGEATLQPGVELPGLEHVFTHFRLSIQPVSVHWPRSVPPQGLTPGLHSDWVPVPALAATALPAPIKKLLHHYFQHPGC